MDNLIKYLAYNFMLIFILYKSMNLTIRRELIYNKKVEILSYISYYIITSIFYLLIGIPIIMLTINIISIFIIQFNYKTNLKDKLLITIYIYLMMFILDIFTVSISNRLDLQILQMFTETRFISLISIIIELTLFYIVLKSIKNLKNMELKINMPKIFWLPLMIIPILSIGFTILMLYLWDIQVKIFISILILLMIINLTLFIMYNFLVEAIKKKEEQQLLEQQNIMYLKEFELMQDKFEMLNIFKHDLKKHLNYINQLVINKNYDESLNYIKTILDTTNKSILKDKIVNTGNVCIDIVLNLKLQECLKQNIKIKTEALIPYDLEIPSLDLVCLLGNLLDNAIEASVKLEEKDKFIYVKIKYYDKELFINIKNKYKEILKDENNNIISSKLFRKEKKGIGLKAVRKIVDDYNGILSIEELDNIFDLSIILKLDD